MNEVVAVAELLEHLCSQAGRRVEYRDRSPRGLPQILSGRPTHDVPQLPVHEFGGPRTAGSDIGPRFQQRDLAGKPIWQRHIVGIHAGHILGRDQVNNGVQRGHQPGVYVMADNTNPRVVE